MVWARPLAALSGGWIPPSRGGDTSCRGVKWWGLPLPGVYPPGAAQVWSECHPTNPIGRGHLRGYLEQTISVAEYLLHLDPQKAALAAGYAKTVGRTKAYQWVSNSKQKPHVYAAVGEAQDKQAERTQITADRVLKELAVLGFVNMDDYMRVGKDRDPFVDRDHRSSGCGSAKSTRTDGPRMLSNAVVATLAVARMLEGVTL